MKKITAIKINNWKFDFSEQVDRRDIKHVLRVLERQFNLFKRKARLERLKAQRPMPTATTNGHPMAKEQTNARSEQTNLAK